MDVQAKRTPPQWQLAFDFLQSRHLALFLLASHLLILAYVVLWRIDGVLKIALVTLLLLNLLWYWHREIHLLGEKSPKRLSWTPQGWLLEFPEGPGRYYQLDGATWMQGWFIYLVLKPLQHRRLAMWGFHNKGLFICADRIGVDNFRRLQVFLRWQPDAIRRPLVGGSDCEVDSSVDNLTESTHCR